MKTHLPVMGVAGNITSGSKEELFMNLREKWELLKKLFFSDWKKGVYTAMWL